MPIALPYRLKLSPTLRNEWRVRNIGETIPELDGACWDVPAPSFTAEVMRQIAADARFMLDPNGPDLTRVSGQPIGGF